MRNCVPLLGVFGLTLVLSLGCARQTEVTKIYDDIAGPEKAYKRLLVADVSSDPNRQQLFEDEIVNQLRRKNVDGVAVYTKLTFAGGVRPEEITNLANEAGADGILVTRLVSVSAAVEVEEGRTDIQSTCRRGNLADYFLYDHDVIREADSLKAAYEVIVISSLYDVATRKRVWAIQSTCFEKSSMSEVLSEEARVIVQQLRVDELI
jgi:hypothetical protein